MNSCADFTKAIIDRYEIYLSEYVTLSDFRSGVAHAEQKLPNEKGVYFVIWPYSRPDCMFLEVGSGGHFKDKDPNISKEELRANWVDDADILYIGKAGGKNLKATLRQRIVALLRFGNGEPVAHWGGRLLWQHKDSCDFRVYWAENEDPVTSESQLLKEFKSHYGKLPFANLKFGKIKQQEISQT